MAETFSFFQEEAEYQDSEVQWLVRIALAHSYAYAHRAAAGGRRRASYLEIAVTKEKT